MMRMEDLGYLFECLLNHCIDIIGALGICEAC